MKKSYLILLFFLITTFSIAISSCSDREEPPYIKAIVTDAAGNKTLINNFKLLYWWEERGETPFLKPYTLYTKELIVEIEEPIDNNPKRIRTSTERYPLQNLELINIINTESGYEINIETKNGEEISATENFPGILKKGTDTGLADHMKYAYGRTIKDGEENEFKKSLNILKEIKIIEVKSETYQ